MKMSNGHQFAYLKLNNLSFVQYALPELDNRTLNLIQQRVPEKLNNHEVVKKIPSPPKHCENFDDCLEITGNPLEYNTIIEDDLNMSCRRVQKMWKEDEENYFAFDKADASNLLSHVQNDPKENGTPTFVICKPEEDNETVLLGCHIENNCFTTTKINDNGWIGISQIEFKINSGDENCHKRVQASDKLNTLSFCEYDIFGVKSNYTTIDGNFKGSVSLSAKWNSATFKPCDKTSKVHVFLETTANSKESLLSDLWKQQILLNDCLNILEKYKTAKDTDAYSKYKYSPLKFPNNFSTPYFKQRGEIMKSLEKLWNDKDNQIISLANTIGAMNANSRSIQNEVKLSKAVEDIPNRPNLDFTDNLWKIMRSFDTCEDISNAIHLTLDKISSPQINATNKTLFAELLQMINKNLIKLSPQQPLEYLVNMGIEKLVGDYLYLLRITNLTNAQEIGRKLNVSRTEFDVAVSRDKLLLMAQMNICLEFGILAEKHLDYEKEHLGRLMHCAFQQYCHENSPLRSFEQIEQVLVYNLNISAPIEFLNNELSRVPLLHRVEFNVCKKKSGFRTIHLFCKSPLFPASLSPEKDIDYDDENYSEGVMNHVTCYVSCLQLPV